MSNRPIPDVELKVWLVPYGYQVDTYVHGQRIAMTCRDYGGDEESRGRHIQVLLEEITGAFERLRERMK